MGSRAGLQKVVKSVRGKKGTVRRTYWVKTKDAVKGAGRFLNKHKGKIAGAALLAGAAYLGHKHRGALSKIHQAGMDKARQQYRGATHPDRVAQGRSTGKVQAAAQAARGYFRGVKRGATPAASAAYSSAKSRAEAAVGAVKRAANYVADSRVGKSAGRAGSAVAGSRAGQAAANAGSRVASSVRSAASSAASSARGGVRRVKNRARGHSNDTTLTVRR